MQEQKAWCSQKWISERRVWNTPEPTLELWHGSITRRSHKLGKEELRCMAQFQGIQVLSIKEAVLMQKKKIKRRDWSIFFHLFFFFWSDVKRIPWNSTKHLLAPGGAWKSSLQNSPHEMAAFRDLASSPGAEGQQTPLSANRHHSAKFKLSLLYYS